MQLSETKTMSSIRKDQPRPGMENEETDTGERETLIAKPNVLKSFYQREIEERDTEIERLKQDNQRLRAKIISGDFGGGGSEDGEGAAGPDRAELDELKRNHDIAALLVGSLSTECDTLQTELAEQKEKVLRTLAELENLRRRTEREKADMAKYAISEFARDVIGIGDNIQRAIDHVPFDAAETDSTLKSFLEGVQLLERELLATLDRHGVVRVNPQGEKFDPNKHQAVMEQEAPDVPSGTVLQVLQAGFMIAERTLRPAVVVVSRGGAKTPKAADKPAEPAPELPPAATTEAEAEAKTGDEPSAAS
jgi:molecular chaperone GrpE